MVQIDKLLGVPLMHEHTASDITDLPEPTVDVLLDGSNLDPQQEVLAKILEPQVGIDLGALDGFRNPAGYYPNTIDSKRMTNTVIGGNTREVDGAIRSIAGFMQFHNGVEWLTVVTGFRFREREAGGYALEHDPLGTGFWITVHNGNSVDYGLNGEEIMKTYLVDIGACPHL